MENEIGASTKNRSLTFPFTRRQFIIAAGSSLAVSMLPQTGFGAEAISAEVCVYGATASGVAAAMRSAECAAAA